MVSEELTNIQKWLSGKNILVTGGTGFMGKVLLEKLLRCIPNVGKIYVIVRPKRGLTPEERLEQMKNMPVFSRLLSECPKAFIKLNFLEGNLTQENLGLSEQSINELVKKVSVVFHLAASLRLEAEVKEAVIANTLGTKRVMDLCKGMKLVESIVHLSTAFCHCDVESLEEKTYPSLQNPYDMIKLVETESVESLYEQKMRLIAPHPNSYTFSKRLAESVVEDYEESLPVVITRPSMVLPAFQEPIPGWVDSLNGPIGVLVASGKGVLRSMLCKTEFNAEIIPVDCAINGLIFAAYYRAIFKKRKVLVVNLSAPREEISITWDEVFLRTKNAFQKCPFEWMLWYPDGEPTTNVLKHWLVVILFQWIPAILLDGVFFIIGRERFLIKVQKKIMVGVDVLKYFTLNKWDIKTDKFKVIVDKYLIGKDKELFQLINFNYDIDQFILTSILGARLYCMKEKLSTIKYTRIHLKVLKILHYTSIFLFWYFVLRGILAIFDFKLGGFFKIM